MSPILEFRLFCKNCHPIVNVVFYIYAVILWLKKQINIHVSTSYFPSYLLNSLLKAQSITQIWMIWWYCYIWCTVICLINYKILSSIFLLNCSIKIQKNYSKCILFVGCYFHLVGIMQLYILKNRTECVLTARDTIKYRLMNET